MIKLDENKLAKLTSFDSILDKKYGKEGSAERKEFDAKAKAWYFAELLKEERKKQKVSQQALADQIGKKRVYHLMRKGTNRHAAFYVSQHCQCLRASLFTRCGIIRS